MRVKVVSVVGARPQFIKAAPLTRAMADIGIVEYMVHTGQHYDREMSGTFFDELELRQPDLNLNVGSGSHAEQTAGMLTGLEEAIGRQQPRWVLVYGDTNSTLAGALAAAKLNIPIAHIEAGLRSFNRTMPEEINRIVTDRLSDLLFVPTHAAGDNLKREGVENERIVWTGDVMYDVALRLAPIARERSRAVEMHGLEPGRYVLATVHRAENTDSPSRLRAIVDGLKAAAVRMQVVLPLHPRTRTRIKAIGLDTGPIRVTSPLGILDMVRLEIDAAVIATDSGGVQKEAFFHGVPCVTLRDETEWIELVNAGWNRVVAPTNADRVWSAVLGAVGTLGRQITPYGHGEAAIAIAKALVERR